MSEEPGKYSVGGQVEPNLEQLKEMAAITEYEDKAANSQLIKKGQVVQGSYFRRVATFAEAAVMAGATEVDDIVNFAIQLTDKIIERTSNV